MAAIGGIAILERIWFYFLYRPVAYNDTASYRRLAGEVLAGWNTYDGTRMPGYPVFLAVLGPDKNVYMVQLFLGFCTTLLLFYIGWRISGHGWVGGLFALAHTFNLQQLFFEADLLTETLTTFLIAITLTGMAWLIYPRRKHPVWHILLAGAVIGLSSGLAVLVRTIFIYLPLLAAFLLLLFWQAPKSRRVGAALMVVLGGLICLGSWLNFMHRTYHEWSLSTVDGYHLMNHAGVFFEYAPDQYAAVRDTFLQYRDQQIAETGSSSNTIWNAIPALENASGLGFFDLSRLLEKISIHLILEHPSLYLRNVLLGWIAFWKVPFHWAVDEGGTPLQGALRGGLILVTRGALFGANLAFLGGSMMMVWKKIRRFLKMDVFWWFILAVIWLTSIIQTLLEYGDNPRYSVPVQSLVVLVVLWWGFQILTHFLRRKHENSLA